LFSLSYAQLEINAIGPDIDTAQGGFSEFEYEERLSIFRIRYGTAARHNANEHVFSNGQRSKAAIHATRREGAI
jgi:hypothetical protein